MWELEAWAAGAGDSNPRNVALASAGAKSSASSFALENQTRHHENAIDGELDRRQSYPWRAASSEPAWLRVDFAEPAVIDSIVIHAGFSVPVDYRIEVLPVQGAKWKTVADSRDRLVRLDDNRPAQQVDLPGLQPETISKLVSLNARVRSAQGEVNRLAGGPKVYAASFYRIPTGRGCYRAAIRCGAKKSCRHVSLNSWQRPMMVNRETKRSVEYDWPNI